MALGEKNHRRVDYRLKPVFRSSSIHNKTSGYDNEGILVSDIDGSIGG